MAKIGNYIHQMLRDIGETAIVKVKTQDNVNEWGDEDASYEKQAIQGIFQRMETDHEEVEEGMFRVGDLRVWVDSDSTEEDHIKKENIIVYSGKEYKITGINVENRLGDESHVELRCTPV